MKIHQLSPEQEMIVLRKGELVIENLTRHCKDKGIQNAVLTGLGAVSEIECGYYDLGNREYVFKQYDGLYEVVSIAANVILKDEQPYVHMHALFTDENNKAFGGHVTEMKVGVTLEVNIDKFPTTLTRKYDDDTGLYLIAEG
tara:strand:- start:684 stop:1109 length:426 start_codon:yes stop_codon:yes gene_type:complete